MFDELSPRNSINMEIVYSPKTIHSDLENFSLPTDDALRKRGFYLTSACLLCDTLHCEETLDHLFLQCSFAQRSWSWIMSLFNTSLAFSTWQQFWHSIFSKRFSPRIYNLWMVACLMMTFLIWKARNKVRFDYVKPVFSQICSHALATLRRLGTFLPGFVFPSTDSFILNKIGIPVHLCRAPKVYNVIWKKPTFPWLKVNTDGLSKGNPGLAAAGGIFRDCLGVCHGCFAEPLGIQTSFFAELMAIVLAIEIAVHRGWSSIWLECDSLSAVYCLNNSSFSLPWQIRVRWFNCMTKLKSMNFHVSHVFREGNQAADALANLGLQQINFTWWDSHPAAIDRFINHDIGEFPSYRFA